MSLICDFDDSVTVKKEIDVSLSSIHYNNWKQGKMMFELVSTILN